MRVLHLSADYPDPLAPGKTPAIRNLLALAVGHEHRVWSLNRVGWRARTAALDFDDAVGTGHRAVAYGAPPKGLMLRTRLERLADWIAEDAARLGFRPDAVHAHKLSVEGIAGLRLAGRLGVPLLATSQGDSDLKILAARPDLRPLWRRVWREAAHVLPLAPWTAARLAALLGPREGPVTPLPCPVAAPATPLAPRAAGPRFASVFHLASSRRKNAAALIAAVGVAGRTAPDIALDIVGGGDPAAFAALAACAQATAPGRVRFLGPVGRDAVAPLLNARCAMALPSRRESFGMVFPEALFAGTPCLAPRGWGLDGWLVDGEAAALVDPADIGSIADGLARLARDEMGFKARLAALHARGGLDFLRDAAIAAAYGAALAAAAPGASI